MACAPGPSGTEALPGSSRCGGPNKQLLTEAVVETQFTGFGLNFTTSALALTQTHIYWVDRTGGVAATASLGKSGAIRRVAKAGGSVEDVLSAPADRVLLGVIASDAKIYALFVGNFGEGAAAFLGEVGTTLERLTPARVKGWDPLLTGLSGVSDGDIWITTGADRAATDKDARIIRVAPSGAETVVFERAKRPASFTAAVSSVEQLWLQGGDVYFLANQGTAGLWKINGLGSGSASVVSPNNLAAAQVAVGAGYVFTTGLAVTRRTLDFMQPTSIFDAIDIYGTAAYAAGFDATNLIVLSREANKAHVAYSVSSDGATQRPIACDGIGYDSFQGDGNAWFWVDGDPSGLRSIAKATR